jgi:hypothetical protein
MKTVQKEESQYFIFFKLFIIMGVTWIVEIAHGLWHGNHTEQKDYVLGLEVNIFF